MLSKIFIGFGIVFLMLFVACSKQDKEPTIPITETDQKNLELVEKDHVAFFGAPPMLPKTHPSLGEHGHVITENGGKNCLDCHSTVREGINIPQTSHPERKNCLQCHIPDNDETATKDDFKVDSNFKKYTPSN